MEEVGEVEEEKEGMEEEDLEVVEEEEDEKMEEEEEERVPQSLCPFGLTSMGLMRVCEMAIAKEPARSRSCKEGDPCTPQKKFLHWEERGVHQ